MMADTASDLWPLVILNTALFAIFAVSFFHPRTGRDWRAMGGFPAFLVALLSAFVIGPAISGANDAPPTSPSTPGNEQPSPSLDHNGHHT